MARSNSGRKILIFKVYLNRKMSIYRLTKGRNIGKSQVSWSPLTLVEKDLPEASIETKTADQPHQTLCLNWP